MKKILLFASALVILSACSKEAANNEVNQPNNAEGKQLTIGASVAPQTKVVLTGDAEGIDIVWAAGDKVRAFDLGTGPTNPSTELTLKVGTENTNAGEFTGTDPRIAVGTEDNKLGVFSPFMAVENPGDWSEIELVYHSADKMQHQATNNSMEHLSMFTYLAGEVDMEKKYVHLNHKSSFLRFEIAGLPADFDAKDLTISLLDEYKIMWEVVSSDGTVGTKVNALSLNLDGVVVADGEKLVATMAIAPFQLAGETLTITLTGMDDTKYVYSKAIEIEYMAGQIHLGALNVSDMMFIDPLAPKAVCAPVGNSFFGTWGQIAGLNSGGVQIFAKTGDEMNATPIMDMTAGEVYQIEINNGDKLQLLGNNRDAGGQAYSVAMWIDWDNSGMFEADEKVIVMDERVTLAGSAVAAPYGPEYVLAVPTDLTYDETTRFTARLVGSHNSDMTPESACAEFGESTTVIDFVFSVYTK